MNQIAILDRRALAYASLCWWQDHCDELRRKREYSLSSGEGVLCQALEAAHHLAVHRTQQARIEWLSLKDSETA